MTLVFLCLNTKTQAQSKYDIKCYISQIIINQDSLFFSGDKNSTTSQIPKLTLASKNNFIKFIYSCDSKINNANAEYEVFLSNYDKEWAKWSNLREMHYANLPAGKYIFYIQARINDEISNLIAFHFEVEPSFWVSNLAYILYAILLILFIILIISIHKHKVERENNNLRQIVNERTQNIIETNSKLEQKTLMLNKTLNDMSQLNIAGQRIIKNLNIKDISMCCFEEINKFFDNTNFGIATFNAPKMSLDVQTFILEGQLLPFARYNIENVNNLFVYSYINNKTIVIDDYSKEIGNYIQDIFINDLQSCNSAIYMPLHDNDMTIGVLTIQHKKYNYYNTYHLGIINHIVTYLEIAIVNFRYFQKNQIQKRTIETRNDELFEAISKLKASQKKNELQTLELKNLTTVINQTDNALSIYDLNGNNTWYNEGFKNMYSSIIDSNTIIGTNFCQIYKDDISKEIYEKVYQNAHAENYQFSFKNDKDQTIWLQSTITPILDEHNNVAQIAVIDSDISESKKAEEEIKTKNKGLTESIQYAFTIQQAVMPSHEIISEIFKEYFILNLPKDIVSGDFFWVYEKFGRKYFAQVDCAGHGVPGAFVSLMGKMFLDEIMHSVQLEHGPGEIIMMLNHKLNSAVNSLTKKIGGIDGMDMGLCILNSRKTVLQYAGAYRPLYLVREHELTIIAADRSSVGNIPIDTDFTFTNHEIDIEKGDLIFLTSDGYADQFGSTGKKFGRKNFTTLLEDLSNYESTSQMREFALQRHLRWRGTIEQIDDIMLVGIKIV